MILIGRRLSPGEWRQTLDDPDLVEKWLDGDEAPEPELDLNKAWHGLHYLLTGTAWTVGSGAGAAILGGTAIGEDNGYGPARILSPELVGEVAAGLGEVSVAALRARFDDNVMTSAQIYPSPWYIEDEPWLTTHFATLAAFYQEAAARGDAVLLTLT